MSYFYLAWRISNLALKTLACCLSVILAYLGVCMICSFAIYRYDGTNTFFHALLWPVTNTRWSDGYSDENFKKIHVGMNQQEVIHFLGLPLAKFENKETGEVNWIYSWSGRIPCCGSYEGNFHRRDIRLSSSGIVQNVIREYDAD
jgi:hypothetical protein